MNTDLLVNCGWPGILGICFQIIIKLISLKKRSNASNGSFRIGDYFKDDYLNIIASVLAVVITIVCLENLAHWKPAVMEYVQVLFIAVGYMGSSLINSLLSKSEKQILSVIDKKTNLGDLLTEKSNASASGTAVVTQSEIDSVTPVVK